MLNLLNQGGSDPSKSRSGAEKRIPRKRGLAAGALPEVEPLQAKIRSCKRHEPVQKSTPELPAAEEPGREEYLIDPTEVVCCGCQATLCVDVWWSWCVLDRERQGIEKLLKPLSAAVERSSWPHCATRQRSRRLAWRQVGSQDGAAKHEIKTQLTGPIPGLATSCSRASGQAGQDPLSHLQI